MDGGYEAVGVRKEKDVGPPGSEPEEEWNGFGYRVFSYIRAFASASRSMSQSCPPLNYHAPTNYLTTDVDYRLPCLTLLPWRDRNHFSTSRLFYFPSQTRRKDIGAGIEEDPAG
jgi:hypothetical protein